MDIIDFMKSCRHQSQSQNGVRKFRTLWPKGFYYFQMALMNESEILFESNDNVGVLISTKKNYIFTYSNGDLTLELCEDTQTLQNLKVKYLEHFNQKYA